MTKVQYPQSQTWSAYYGTTTTPGPYLGYAYDTMGRLNTMTDLAASNTLISGTTYDPANRLLTIAGYYNESRSYNVMGQLVGLSNNSVNLTYSYSATQNNGKITGQTDNISGEQVVYAYDALNRLASAGATSGTWGQSYGYDGFGNLQSQTVTAGTAPSLSVSYNPSNNRQTTDCADANGNIWGSQVYSGCYGVYANYAFDVSNRIVSATGGVQYSYAPGNKRIWKGINTGSGLTQDTITFWSVTGQKLGDYNLTGDPTIQYTNTPPPLTAALATANYYFGGKQIAKVQGAGNSPAFTGSDRLGSFGKYYPWGQEKPSATGNNTEKFTGYFNRPKGPKGAEGDSQNRRISTVLKQSGRLRPLERNRGLATLREYPMSRNARCILPGLAYHVTQRGSNRQKVFFSAAHRKTYLGLLERNCPDAGVHVLAWCLMSNHVHLVVVPERADSLAVLFRRVHGAYAQAVNAGLGRTGHLWQNRFYSCPLSERHLWIALRYVEANPVRAAMAARPEEYRWSSAAAHLGTRAPELASTLDGGFWQRAGGAATWREMHASADGDSQLNLLRRCTYAGRPFGEEEFIEQIERQFHRQWRRWSFEKAAAVG